jgi:hypothetical protein
MEDEKKALSPIGIGISDLRVIGHVLMPYAKGIENIIPPSPKRDALLNTTQLLRERIAAAKTSVGVGLAPAQEQGKDHLFPLTHDELAVIDSAFTAFVENIGQCVPQSEERDEIIRGCKALRSHIIASCTPPDAL